MENYNKICEVAVTLTGACALVVRGGDGGRDSTGSDGVALLAIPRSPLLRDHDPDENACIRWCLRLRRPRQQLRLLGTAMWSPDIADAVVVAAVVADGDVAAVVVAEMELVAFCYSLADSGRLLVGL